jgi:hypothetical protein
LFCGGGERRGRVAACESGVSEEREVVERAGVRRVRKRGGGRSIGRGRRSRRPWLCLWSLVRSVGEFQCRESGFARASKVVVGAPEFSAA